MSNIVQASILNIINLIHASPYQPKFPKSLYINFVKLLLYTNSKYYHHEYVKYPLMCNFTYMITSSYALLMRNKHQTLVHSYFLYGPMFQHSKISHYRLTAAKRRGAITLSSFHHHLHRLHQPSYTMQLIAFLCCC